LLILEYTFLKIFEGKDFMSDFQFQNTSTFSSKNVAGLESSPFADQQSIDAQNKLDKYIEGLKGASLSADAKQAISNLMAQYGKKEWGWASEEDCKQIQLMAFYDENMNPGSEAWSDPRSVNGFTAAFFAACGLKIFDNTSDWNQHSRECKANVNVFEEMKKSLGQGMSEDDFHFTLGNLISAEDQEKLVALRRKVQPMINFCNSMTAMINEMVSYCKQAGLGDGDNPCYNITRQWESKNDQRYPGHWETKVDQDGYEYKEYITDDPKHQKDQFVYRPEQSGYADSRWSKSEKQEHRDANIRQNFELRTPDGAFCLTSSEFSKLLMDKLKSFTDFFS
jgi:hypothetical protein